MSRDELQQRVWGVPYRPRDRSVDVCVRQDPREDRRALAGHHVHPDALRHRLPLRADAPGGDGMTANIHEPEWDAETDREPYRWRRSLLGRRAGAERLGASLFDVPPGGIHLPVPRAPRERGAAGRRCAARRRCGRRTASGCSAEGEVVAFPAGRQGAHAVSNRSRRDRADRDRVHHDRARHQRVPRLRHALGAQLRAGLRAARRRRRRGRQGRRRARPAGRRRTEPTPSRPLARRDARQRQPDRWCRSRAASRRRRGRRAPRRCASRRRGRGPCPGPRATPRRGRSARTRAAGARARCRRRCR